MILWLTAFAAVAALGFAFVEVRRLNADNRRLRREASRPVKFYESRGFDGSIRRRCLRLDCPVCSHNCEMTREEWDRAHASDDPRTQSLLNRRKP